MMLLCSVALQGFCSWWNVFHSQNFYLLRQHVGPPNIVFLHCSAWWNCISSLLTPSLALICCDVLLIIYAVVSCLYQSCLQTRRWLVCLFKAYIQVCRCVCTWFCEPGILFSRVPCQAVGRVDTISKNPTQCFPSETPFSIILVKFEGVCSWAQCWTQNKGALWSSPSSLQVTNNQEKCRHAVLHFTFTKK